MSKSTAAVLRAAKKLIDTPRKWCKGHSGRRYSNDGQIKGRCAFWAQIDATSDVRARGRSLTAFIRAAGLANIGDIGIWNDSRSTKHADVMRAFDRAIRAEARKP